MTAHLLFSILYPLPQRPPQLSVSAHLKPPVSVHLDPCTHARLEPNTSNSAAKASRALTLHTFVNVGAQKIEVFNMTRAPTLTLQGCATVAIVV